jgi:hypothetical protein
MSGACAGPCESAPASAENHRLEAVAGWFAGLRPQPNRGNGTGSGLPGGLLRHGDDRGSLWLHQPRPFGPSHHDILGARRSAASGSIHLRSIDGENALDLASALPDTRPTAAHRSVDPPSAPRSTLDRRSACKGDGSYCRAPIGAGLPRETTDARDLSSSATQDASVTLIPRRLDQAAPPAGRPANGAAELCTLLVPTRRARRQGPGVLEGHESRNEPSRANSRRRIATAVGDPRAGGDGSRRRIAFSSRRWKMEITSLFNWLIVDCVIVVW